MRSAENRSDGAIARLNTLSALEARGVRPSKWLSKQVLIPGQSFATRHKQDELVPRVFDT
jgi:hypothetical protein